jgi:large subunit ribosomal protein L35
MPKMKTSSSGKKRFKRIASGKIKRSKAFRRHLMTCKSRKTKRQLREKSYVSASDMVHIDFLLPY